MTKRMASSALNPGYESHASNLKIIPTSSNPVNLGTSISNNNTFNTGYTTGSSNNSPSIGYAENDKQPQDTGENQLETGVGTGLATAGEFLGTFVLVYLGQSALTSFELIGTQNDMLTRKVATIFAQGLAYAFASLLTINLSGAHLNPAHTFASAAFGHLNWSRAFAFQCAQYLGAFMSAIFLHATYGDKLNQRHTEGELFGSQSHLRAHGNVLSTGKLFSSHPPTEVSLTQLTISYTLATAHLTLLTLAISHSKVIKITKSLRPLYFAAALSLVLAAFSANGGPVWNPAQDFSPRLYIALFGWGSAAFNLYNYRYWWLCGIVAPHLGALIGFALYRLFGHLRLHEHSKTENMLINDSNTRRHLHYNLTDQFHNNHEHVNLV